MVKDWLKPETFKGRSVLVTGHTGFKGSWLAIWLNRLGAKVSGYSLAPPTDPNNFSASRVREILAEDVEADIRDADRLTWAIEKVDPDVVFHLAAQSLVRTSYTAPRETFDVNVMGTATVLDAVRARGKPCVVVIVTSDKCYENREQVWGYRETDPLGGHDPYSASKGAVEILAACYRCSFFPPHRLAQHGVKLATARAGNVIEPDFISALDTGGGSDRLGSHTSPGWFEARRTWELAANSDAGKQSPLPRGEVPELHAWSNNVRA